MQCSAGIQFYGLARILLAGEHVGGTGNKRYTVVFIGQCLQVFLVQQVEDCRIRLAILVGVCLLGILVCLHEVGHPLGQEVAGVRLARFIYHGNQCISLLQHFAKLGILFCQAGGIHIVLGSRQCSIGTHGHHLCLA